MSKAAGEDARATWPGRPRPELPIKSYSCFYNQAQPEFWR